MWKAWSFVPALVAVALGTASAFADDWTAIRLRGTVLAVDVQDATRWVKLRRDDVVSAARTVRTLTSGNVAFQRGSETVAFGPNTQAAIADRQGRRPYTTVVQQMGTVAVEADVRQVQHFAVETPYLVAVVKGTVFTVSTDRHGSRVHVSRGLVEVTGTGDRHSVMVAAGQTASASADGEVAITGTANAVLTHPVVDGIVEDGDDGGVAGSLGDALGDAVGNVGGALGSTVGDLGGTVGSTVGELGGTLGSTVGDVTGSSGLGNTVSGVTGVVGDTVGGVTGAVGTTIGGVTGGVGNTLHHLGL